MIARDVDYAFGGTVMRGLLLASDDGVAAPTIVLIHDAFGLGGFSLDMVHRFAELGYTVFAADVWGDRTTAGDESEIGPLIGGIVADRATWRGRVDAAHEAARALAEVDPDRIVTIGYCFGGSSALEFARTGGEVLGVVAVHPGLDLLEPDALWTPAPGVSTLVCIGADDPMATTAQRDDLAGALSAASVDWQFHLYGGTTHAFTNPRLADPPHPQIFAYHPRRAARAWEATLGFLTETFETPATVPAGTLARNDKEER